MKRPIKVHRDEDKTSFLIDPNSFEPLTNKIYDPNVMENPSAYIIISFHDWILQRTIEKTNNG